MPYNHHMSNGGIKQLKAKILNLRGFPLNAKLNSVCWAFTLKK